MPRFPGDILFSSKFSDTLRKRQTIFRYTSFCMCFLDQTVGSTVVCKIDINDTEITLPVQVGHHVMQSAVVAEGEPFQQLLQRAHDVLHLPRILSGMIPLTQMLDLFAHSNEVVVQVKCQKRLR